MIKDIFKRVRWKRKYWKKRI